MSAATNAMPPAIAGARLTPPVCSRQRSIPVADVAGADHADVAPRDRQGPHDRRREQRLVDDPAELSRCGVDRAEPTAWAHPTACRHTRSRRRRRPSRRDPRRCRSATPVRRSKREGRPDRRSGSPHRHEAAAGRRAADDLARRRDRGIPAEHTGAGIERDDMADGRADEDRTIADRRRGRRGDGPAAVPANRPSRHFEAVEDAPAIRHVDEVRGCHGTRQ